VDSDTTFTGTGTGLVSHRGESWTGEESGKRQKRRNGEERELWGQQDMSDHSKDQSGSSWTGNRGGRRAHASKGGEKSGGKKSRLRGEMRGKLGGGSNACTHWEGGGQPESGIVSHLIRRYQVFSLKPSNRSVETEKNQKERCMSMREKSGVTQCGPGGGTGRKKGKQRAEESTSQRKE